MDTGAQALFFGLACLAFLLACIISVIKAPPEDRLTAFNWTALGLLLFVFVPFVIALRSS